MLVPIVFILALILTLATAMLESGLAAAKITVHASAARYSDVAMADGVADFTAGLAAFIKVHGSRGPWPAAASESYPKPVCGAAVPAAQCPYSFVIRGVVTDPASSATAGGRRDSVSNLQTSLIEEARISATVSTTLTAANGTLLGTRTRLLTYRVFEAAPYAIVSGSQDAAATVGSQVTAQGDDSGAPAAGPAEAGPDTRIHVVLSCAVIGPKAPPGSREGLPGNDGLPWGNAANAANETPCHQPTSPADRFADGSWTNGNANTSGWTQ